MNIIKNTLKTLSGIVIGTAVLSMFISFVIFGEIEISQYQKLANDIKANECPSAVEYYSKYMNENGKILNIEKQLIDNKITICKKENKKAVLLQEVMNKK